MTDFSYHKEELVAGFRIYYNHTIYPELVRQEKKRKRLLRLFFFSSGVIILLFALALSFNIFAFTIFLTIPLGAYLAFLVFRFTEFRLSFKPHIVNLILDYLDDLPFIRELSFHVNDCIEKTKFLESGIFATDAPSYQGEDLITGQIRDLSFLFCELQVKEFSKVRSRLNDVFRGVFMMTKPREPINGSILILPRNLRQFLTATIKQANKSRMRELHKVHLPAFEESFMTYATADAPVKDLLSAEMQQNLLHFKQQRNKEIFLSLSRGTFYFALSEPDDLLEPALFSSNLRFDLIKGFFDDIFLLIDFIDDFDKHQ